MTSQAGLASSAAGWEGAALIRALRGSDGEALAAMDGLSAAVFNKADAKNAAAHAGAHLVTNTRGSRCLRHLCFNCVLSIASAAACGAVGALVAALDCPAAQPEAIWALSILCAANDDAVAVVHHAARGAVDTIATGADVDPKTAGMALFLSKRIGAWRASWEDESLLAK